MRSVLTGGIARSLREEGLDSQDRSQGENSGTDPHPAPRRLTLDLEHLMGCALVLLGAGAAAADVVAALRRVGLAIGMRTSAIVAAVTAARETSSGSERSDGLEMTDGEEVRRASRHLARRIREGTEPIAGIPPPDKIDKR